MRSGFVSLIGRPDASTTKSKQSISFVKEIACLFVILPSLFISLGIILALELINTAIEAAVDLTTSKIHPLAKIAKDFISSFFSSLSYNSFRI
mgnify:CR=1 FL=1